MPRTPATHVPILGNYVPLSSMNVPTRPLRAAKIILELFLRLIVVAAMLTVPIILTPIMLTVRIMLRMRRMRRRRQPMQRRRRQPMQSIIALRLLYPPHHCCRRQ